MNLAAVLSFFVNLQVELGCILLKTDVALELLSSTKGRFSMDLHMSFQIPLLSKAFSALSAVKWLLVCMDPCMIH